jgi:hypothetical protein
MPMMKKDEAATYRFFVNQKFFAAIDDLLRATQSPTLENIARSYSSLRVVPSYMTHKHDKEMKKCKETLKDIGIILYGDRNNRKTLETMGRYRVMIETSGKTKAVTLKDGQNILEEMMNIFELFKKWGAEQKLFHEEVGTVEDGIDEYDYEEESEEGQ